ncbi:MAG: Bug family tripartite tricarboxylate transporter substrate binding protein [Burkholderiaceae bacterium]
MKPLFVAALMALCAWVNPVVAQGFPSKPITIIVVAPPGGTADIAARMLQEPLGKALGTSVVIDNKGGGNGAVATNALLAGASDGHVLMMQFSGFHAMTPHLVKLPYDTLKDIQPVANVLSAPQVLALRSTLPFQTAQELVDYARKNPGKLNYSSAGNGSVQHIAAELFKNLTNTRIVHIPYRGTGPMVTDLLANQVDFTLTTAPPLVGHIQAGKLRPLLVASTTRLAALPNVPTAAEAGIKGFEVQSWFALYTHGQAPKANVQRVADEVQKIMATPEFQKKAAEQGAQAIFMGPEQMANYARSEFARWGEVIAKQGIKAD